ncbi:hypothetical protein [Couchioplanes azureus]|nr:hypothetical protein [Couchioplanes caeruleus]
MAAGAADHRTRPAVAGGLGLVLLLAALLWPRKRTCGGLHCPGCRHH